jgi:hypothetical protein
MPTLYTMPGACSLSRPNTAAVSCFRHSKSQASLYNIKVGTVTAP